jgi:23S rRNA (cytidine1920-2'-O)/16S rRNA (cytidine1409-2'-O)-methyltransferase
VSRGGLKLAFALDHFGVDVSGRTCADLGSNTGGFVDCLLQRGAAKVYAVDTGYGALAWTLRRDDRVVVMERTNALHVVLPEPISMVTIDVAWTRQHLIVPQAVSMLGGGPGEVLTLIKPHYEAHPKRLRRGVLPAGQFESTVAETLERLAEAGTKVEQMVECPIVGRAGNREMWGWIRR